MVNLHNKITPFTVTIAAFAVATLSGCAGKKPTGNLLIIGGALSDSNQEIYSLLFNEIGEDQSLGIVPTASGVPEETGPENLEFFSSVSGGRKVELIDLPYNKPERGLDPAYAVEIEKQQGLYFLGGDQSRILNLFSPEQQETVTYKAAQSVLAKGGIIAGSSAGAAMMSDPMITWGYSPEALVIGDPNIPDRGVGLSHGMGFFPYGLTDQHFDRRGRLGRLVAGLEETNQPRGYGISENRGIFVHLKNDQIVTVGTQAVMMVDLSAYTRTGFERQNILISYLGEGDTVNGKTGVITIGPNKSPYTPVNSAPITLPESIWDVEQLNNLILDFSISNEPVVEVKDIFFTIRFSKTDSTKFFISDQERPRETIGFTNMRLDFVPLPELEANLEKLRLELATTSNP